MSRDTPQRRAIRDAILDADRPLTPEEVLEAGRSRVPTLGLATVYRNLKELGRGGWLQVVELAGEPARYERAGKPHHHHFLCRGCEGAFDVEGCAERIDALVPSGFTMEEHQLVLHGLCPDCD